jgi:hypothetical protein
MAPSKARRIFGKVLKEAYDKAGRSSLYALLASDPDLIEGICASIAYELSREDLALADELSAAAMHFAKMYATDVLGSLRDHAATLPKTQAEVRNFLREKAAAKRMKHLKDDAAALTRSLAIKWSQMEDATCLPSTSQMNTPRARASTRPVGVVDTKADAEEQQRRAANRAAILLKNAAIAPPNEPLVSRAITAAGTVINPNLQQDLPRVHAIYTGLREAVSTGTSRIDSVRCVSGQFEKVLDIAFGNAYWEVVSISKKAVDAILTAHGGDDPHARADVARGHGVGWTLSRADALERLFSADGQVADANSLGVYLSFNNPTCLITKAENSVDAQLRGNEMYAVPSGMGLFRRQGFSFRIGDDEVEWIANGLDAYWAELEGTLTSSPAASQTRTCAHDWACRACTASKAAIGRWRSLP